MTFALKSLLPLALFAASTSSNAQSIDDLNIQFHGFATQGFLYTTNNNILTTTSSDGSPQWTEAVINISSQPSSSLRVAVQARYELLGKYSNDLTVDYASADYTVNDRFGVRFGKVKVPSGLYNEVQDIDPSYLWSLLPQGVYPIPSRNGQLAIFGGVAYGSFNLSRLGKLDYRVWSGASNIPSNDGYFVNLAESGSSFPHGLTSLRNGAALHWKTPLPGLMIGASAFRSNKLTADLTIGAFAGTVSNNPFVKPDLFFQYDNDKLTVAAEWSRQPVTASSDIPPLPLSAIALDLRAWFAMASYKLTGKLTAGAYHSQFFDRQAPLGDARYEKDWVVSARYDLNPYLYLKAEQHYIDGTAVGYDTNLNLGGLKRTTFFTILKAGVSF